MATVETGWLDDPDLRRQSPAVAARALRDNPMTMAASSDPLERFEFLHQAFGDLLTHEDGILAAAHTCGALLGVAASSTPGRCIAATLPVDDRSRRPPGAGASALVRLWHVGSVMADHDLAEDHCHVGPVGVEPGFQGMGIGSRMMGVLCGRFDDRHEVAWLETDKQENVRFYQSFGFEVLEEVPVLSFTFWFMRRAPR